MRSNSAAEQQNASKVCGFSLIRRTRTSVQVTRPGFLLPVLMLLAHPAFADSALIAAASNFLTPLRALEAQFESRTGHDLDLVAGSTGQLYAQIINGAPFDVLLAADQERPRLLVANGYALADQQFTYAVGRLALFARSRDAVMDGLLPRLAEHEFRKLAIADPDIAPYGAAARQVLENLKIWSPLSSRIVTGFNVSQAFAMVATGSAEFGILAYSQVLAWDGDGAYELVDDELHDPIRQDAVLLARAADNAAALEFLDFLRSEAAATIIADHGYQRVPAGQPAFRLTE